jgi:hypothetical protein
MTPQSESGSENGIVVEYSSDGADVYRDQCTDGRGFDASEIDRVPRSTPGRAVRGTRQ